MESALYGVYTLVVLYQKSHSFASLTCSISGTPQLVCKYRTRALSMKYSICNCQCQAFKCRSLKRGLRYGGVRYREVPLYFTEASRESGERTTAWKHLLLTGFESRTVS